jgi:nucleotide-binding universal stress UspA family protein
VRYFPGAPRPRALRRLGRTLAIPVLVGALTIPIASQTIVPAALSLSAQSSGADDLRDQRRKVQQQIQAAQNEAEESSNRVARAVAAYTASQAELAAAKADLASTRQELYAARALDATMQAALVEAEARLAQAQADVVAGQQALEAQRAVVKDLVVDLYQQGDPTLVSLSGYLGAQSPSDLIRHEEYADTAAAKQSGIFDDLIAAEVLLQVREDEVQAARDDVAARRAEAAANLATMQRLTEQAEAEKVRFRGLVHSNKAKKQEARAARQADLRMLEKLKREERRIKKKIAPALFAIALIAAGQSSTVTGTLAGQIVMEGYLRLRINPWIRRLLTRMLAIIPAVIVILINGENNIDDLLVFSQVVLSMQLGFAVIPLIHFVSDKKTMGEFTIKPLTQVLAWLITTVLVYLNIRMVLGQTTAFFQESDSVFWKSVIISGGLLFLALLIIAIVYPILKRSPKNIPVDVHKKAEVSFDTMLSPSYQRIAIALDFSVHDQKLIAHALGQAGQQTSFVLIHIVESVSAKIYGKESDDLETRKDQQKLNEYVLLLQQQGIAAESYLGFRRRTKDIVQIVKESKADLLVIGAHGHSGIKDWIYGTTIDTVRHQLKIPILIVSI